MKRTLFGTSILAALLAYGALWAGSPPAEANANPLAMQDTNVVLPGQTRLLGLAVPTDGPLGPTVRSATCFARTRRSPAASRSFLGAASPPR
jgi:TolB protein